MCREKALRSGAIVWIPAVGAGAASERPKACASGREEYNSARLARLVQLAWEQDDPGKLSRVLALLEEALRAELEDTVQLPQDRSVCQVRRRGRRGLKLPPAWNGSGC